MATTYPFDPTGLAETNFIKNEPQVLTEANDTTYRLIVPDFSPFYQDNLKIVHYSEDGETTLQNGIDYTLVMPYVAASRSIGKSIFGAISIHTELVNGHVGVDYRTIGGTWVADKRWVMEQLALKLYNPRVVYWDQVTNVQETFPPIEHPVDVADVYGLRDLLDKFDELIALIASKPDLAALLAVHTNATGNVHQLTAADINLDQVPNMPLASAADIAAAKPLDKLVSLRQLVNAGIIKPQSPG